MKRDVHTETYEDILLFWLLSFSASASFKCWEVSKSTEEEGSQHIKYQRRGIRALVGEFIHGRWKMAASQTTSLVPTWSLCGLVKRFIPNCSILKVTAWFHIHNYSCMNVQFHYSLLTNRLLRPFQPRSPCSDWSLSYLPAAALFQIWKQTLAGPNITLPPYILSLSPSQHYIFLSPFSRYLIQKSSVSATRE